MERGGRDMNRNRGLISAGLTALALGALNSPSAAASGTLVRLKPDASNDARCPKELWVNFENPVESKVLIAPVFPDGARPQIRSIRQWGTCETTRRNAAEIPYESGCRLKVTENSATAVRYEEGLIRSGGRRITSPSAVDVREYSVEILGDDDALFTVTRDAPAAGADKQKYFCTFKSGHHEKPRVRKADVSESGGPKRVSTDDEPPESAGETLTGTPTNAAD